MKELNDPTVRWKITIDNEQFESLRNDERFQALLDLSRAVNALRFCHVSNINSSNDNTTGGRRQANHAFFFSCAALYETLLVINRINKLFCQFPSFKEGLARIQRDKKFQKIREKVLYRIRNYLTFHFSKEVVPSILSDLKLSDYTFLSASDRSNGSISYDLADTIAINYMIDGLEEYGESELERINNIVKIIGELAIAVMKSSGDLINEALTIMGWRFEEEKE